MSLVIAFLLLANFGVQVAKFVTRERLAEEERRAGAEEPSGVRWWQYSREWHYPSKIVCFNDGLLVSLDGGKWQNLSRRPLGTLIADDRLDRTYELLRCGLLNHKKRSRFTRIEL